MMRRCLVGSALFSLTLLLALPARCFQSPAIAQVQSPSPETSSLERQKLQLEVTNLNRPWYFRSEYLSAILPTVIGLLTVLVLYKSGYFQAESVRLENKRTKLENEIQQFESHKIELTRQVGDREAELARLKKEFAEVELIASLERLVRVIVPNNAVGIQYKTNQALGTAPNETDLIDPTLVSIRNFLSTKDAFTADRLAIVQRYLDNPVVRREMKEELRAILENRA